MSEVEGFGYDIFISYCHDDNDPLTGSWVDQFHNVLENWLQKRRGLKNLSIWRDKELQGNTRFDSAIENKINSSALFFVLHSRNYETSDYCKKELLSFIQSTENQPGGLNIGEHSRIFHILLNNFPHQNWPKELAGTSGFAMHDAENDQSLGDFTAPNKDAFQEQLRKIIDATEATLQEMANTVVRQVDVSQNQNLDELKIFIADTADSQTAFRKRLVSDLKQQGHKVVDAIPPPYPFNEHLQRVTDVLEQAQLSIHLLGEFPGRDIQDQDNTSYPCEQVEIGLRSDTRQMIWVPPDLDISTIDDEPHRDWLIHLDIGDRQEHDYQFIRNNEVAFTNIILQEIEKLKQSKPVDFVEQSYLIDTHQKDQQYAYQLAGLMAQKGLNVDFNKESSNPVESMNLFEQSVAQVPNLIITFGQVSPKWLAGRIRQAVKIFASQFEQETSQQLENIWIFLTPDNQGPESLPSLPHLIPVHLLDNSESSALDPEIVGSLLQGAEQ